MPQEVKMATGKQYENVIEFGNPWERMSDQENSEGAEECTCALLENTNVQKNLVGEMLVREQEERLRAWQMAQNIEAAKQLTNKDEPEKVQDHSDIEQAPRTTLRLASNTEEIPDTHVALAWLVTVCFNIPLGVAAICMSMKAANSYQEGKRKKGNRYTRLSLLASLGGIVVTVVLVMSLILYLAVRETSARRRHGRG